MTIPTPEARPRYTVREELLGWATFRCLHGVSMADPCEPCAWAIVEAYFQPIQPTLVVVGPATFKKLRKAGW